MIVTITVCFLWKSMKEKGREMLRALVLCGLAARLRDSKAIMRSTQPAGRLALNVDTNSEPKISHNSRSNSASTPATQYNRSTQPCIPPGSLNRVPASAGVRAGMSPLPGGR